MSQPATTPPRQQNSAARPGGIAIKPPPPVAAHKGSGVPHGHVPAYLPGSASLVEELDQRVLIVLRDGKHIVGTLTSYDQYSNLILNDAVERRMTTTNDKVTYYTDVPLGLYVIRGDSMVLCGSINDMASESVMKQVTLEDFHEKLEEESSEPPLQWDFDTDLIA